jgi:hypothetical protein
MARDGLWVVARVAGAEMVETARERLLCLVQGWISGTMRGVGDKGCEENVEERRY